MADDISIKSNIAMVEEELKKAKITALRMIGEVAEGHAKDILTQAVYTGDKPYQLTGRLRNSITYALSGESAHISEYSYRENGEEKRERYEGKAEGEEGESVFVGTNVVYAAGIETGSHRKAGAVHFLHDAIANYANEYKDIIKTVLG